MDMSLYMKLFQLFPTGLKFLGAFFGLDMLKKLPEAGARKMMNVNTGSDSPASPFSVEIGIQKFARDSVLFHYTQS